MRNCIESMLAAVLFAASIQAGEIILPSHALERDSVIQAIYRTSGLATGKGQISLTWTDVHGRLVDDRKIPVELTDENEAGFPLDLRRAAAMKNTLRVHFSFEGRNKKGEPDKREEDAETTFVAKPPDRAWRDYAIIMWQDYPKKDIPLLKTLGINAGEYVGRDRTPPDFLIDNDLRWYAENLATDFYSAYHRWFPDRPVNWLFRDAKELYKKDPSGKEAFKRHPSLSDPVWLGKIHDRLVDAVKRLSPYRPIFYDLGDESGIADLAAFWDFDFSDESLVPMRRWLHERYGTLDALNRQWGTNFSSWDLVMPMTTNEAMKRTDDNFSGWADFKEWMDIAYARAVKMGVDAVRDVDPDAYAGLEGGQMPGWGGYDYYRLAQSVTAMEPYDIGNNIEILRSINPRIAVVTTAFAQGPSEKHRIWYELLHGNRGIIIWDDKNGFITKDGAVGGRGREVAPYYNELRSGVAALLINSTRLADPIAIHYSQASMRTAWMLAQKPKGDAWALRRSSADERMDNDFLRLRESWCRLIEDEGLQYNFVAYGQIEQGELIRRGYRVLILPHSSSLSAAEAREIRAFVEQGGTVIADSEPGTFDEHSRRLEKPLLADLFDGGESHAFGRGRVVRTTADILNYHQNRLVHKEGEVHRLMHGLLEAAGVRPEFPVTDDSGAPVVGVETHLFRNGGVYLIGLLTNPQLRVDELGPPEFKSNDRFAKPRTVKLGLPQEMYVYDVRASKALGKQKSLTVALDPYEPAIFAASPVAFADLEIAAPAGAHRGETATISFRYTRRSPAATNVFHLDVIDPAGKTVDYYSGNIIAPAARQAKLVPFAVNDAAGKWTLKVHDLVSGQSRTASVEVN
jgi:glycosyl hydrolase family 42 (putative beta-galactosidase)